VSTRAHTAEIDLASSPRRTFDALVRPSAIRVWWSAARVIVVPRAGGVWAAAWGEEENAPEYVTTAIIRVWDPPRRLLLGDYDYLAASGPLPFEADFTTEFEVLPDESGSRLRVTQAGFPADPVADEFYAACEGGWRDTLESLRLYLEGEGM
jgi:uncharacterized protein YndB with AHSA1/START domain